jgi:hypothetical protein
MFSGRVAAREVPRNGETNPSALASEPDRALDLYKDLDDGQFTVWPYRDFSAAQKSLILEANKRANHGVIKSDTTGKVLEPLQLDRIAHVDHVLDRAREGCSFYFNAQVRSAASNIDKSGKRGAEREREETSDYEIGQMTLRQYFEWISTAGYSQPNKKRKQPEPEVVGPSRRTRSQTKAVAPPLSKKRRVRRDCSGVGSCTQRGGREGLSEPTR